LWVTNPENLTPEDQKELQALNADFHVGMRSNISMAETLLFPGGW
jgi:hypothetical protein